MAAAPSRRRLAARGLIALAALAGCRAEPELGSLSLVLPESPARARDLPLRSAFAEYVELPELRRELRLTFASYPSSCDRYQPPEGANLTLMVTLSLPPEQTLGAGTFPAAAPEVDDAGTAVVARPSVLSVVHTAEHAFVLPPGGSLELTTVDVSARGRVTGLLSLEFPGDAQRQAASVRGKFAATLCQAR